MDQYAASTATDATSYETTVAVPHDWDGIGMALRDVYAPCERDMGRGSVDFSDILDRLDHVA